MNKPVLRVVDPIAWKNKLAWQRKYRKNMSEDKKQAEKAATKKRDYARYHENLELSRKKKRKFYHANVERMHEYGRKAYAKHTEDYKRRGKKQYWSNPEKHRRAAKQWVKDNPEKAKATQRKKYQRLKNDVRYILKHRMHGTIRQALKRLGQSKNRRPWEKIVGYTCEDLKKHLELNFLPGMSWEKRNLFHIDHVIPLSAWNFDSPEHPEFKAAWALSNLRPLWKEQNLKKANRLPTLEELNSVKLIK